MPSSDNPMLFLVPDPLVGQNVGGYLVEQPLGEGGMGLVYRARHPILNRHFAIKVLRPEVAADQLVSGNFIREAQTLSSLKHPHIIDIVGFGPLEDGRQFMVMEFLEGHTLQAELEAQGSLPPKRALELADQILDALSAAHSVDVIHRDLKPANVFLSKASGGREVLKLLDFGLAKQQPEKIAELSVVAEAGVSVLAGTPEYIAPEQALGKPASRQSDLYSFGIMLYEMLTGLQPFLADEAEIDRIRSLLSMHIHKRAPNISESSSTTFPPGLEDLVADLLKKEPEQRPGSADTVRSRLLQVQRKLQQESTASRANPLPPEPVSARLETIPLEVYPATEPAPVVVVVEEQRSSAGKWAAVGVGVLLLLAGGLWLFAPGGEKPVVIEAPAATGTGEVAVVAVAAMVPPPVVDKPVAPEPVTPPLPLPDAKPIGKKYRVEIRKTGCEANDRWRTEARANMQELQQAAAARDDHKAWALFEKSEPEITAAIGSAASGEDCELVEQKIQKLARKFKPGGRPQK